MSLATSGGLIKRLRNKQKSGTKRSFDVQVNITPMSDVMASTLCFLLVSASWVQYAKLDANLPTTGGGAAAEASAPVEEEEKLQLQLLLLKDRSIKIDRGNGLEDLPAAPGTQYDWVKLDALLKEVRAQHPNTQDAILSGDPDVEYEHIVAAMDVCIANKLPNVSLAASAVKQ
jgi:biopolymer transport protein ExbD